MNIIVCIKQIQDPEIPPAKFEIDAAANRVVSSECISPVVNPFNVLCRNQVVLLRQAVRGG